MNQASGPSPGPRISLGTAAMILFVTGPTAACYLMTAEPVEPEVQPDIVPADVPQPWLADSLAARTCAAFSACCEDGWREAQTAFCEEAWGLDYCSVPDLPVDR